MAVGRDGRAEHGSGDSGGDSCRRRRCGSGGGGGETAAGGGRLDLDLAGLRLDDVPHGRAGLGRPERRLRQGKR
jgi:hypothetical protein